MTEGDRSTEARQHDPPPEENFIIHVVFHVSIPDMFFKSPQETRTFGFEYNNIA
jgi:hypothetical protein